MELIKPFRGLLPRKEWVQEVIAPGYDTLARDAAKLMARSPWNMLHLTRSEIDCDPEIRRQDSAVYAKAKENWQQFQNHDIFKLDPHPNYYVIRIEANHHVQTGLMCLVSLQAFYHHRIRTFEHTHLQTESDRVQTLEALNAQVSPALFAYRDGTFITDTLTEITQHTTPHFQQIKMQDELHSLWKISDPMLIAQLTDAVRDIGYLYLADGHHHLTAMSRLGFAHPNEETYQYTLGVLFPERALKTQPFHCLLTDLNGMTHHEFIAKLNPDFKVETRSRAVHPDQPHQLGVYLQHQWYRLTYRDLEPSQLAILHLRDSVIKPLFAISDPRDDNRIEFISGDDAIAQLIWRVDAGEMACGFTLPPTPVPQILECSDAGMTLPVKSTRFSPTLSDGLVVYSMEEF